MDEGLRVIGPLRPDDLPRPKGCKLNMHCAGGFPEFVIAPLNKRATHCVHDVNLYPILIQILSQSRRYKGNGLARPK